MKFSLDIGTKRTGGIVRVQPRHPGIVEFIEKCEPCAVHYDPVPSGNKVGENILHVTTFFLKIFNVKSGDGIRCCACRNHTDQCEPD